jgi:hypothetical protein
MSSFQVKCYLIKNVESIQDPIEIKRFNICSQQDSLLYDSLIDAIKRYFEHSFIKSDNEIKTFWLDDEADLIRFSTNFEFLNLISSFNGNLLKIYVQKEKAEKESSCHKDFGEVFSLLNNPQIISNVSEFIGSVFGNMEKPKEKFDLSEKEIEERVQAGVENLMRMGFSNDNECLAKLLRDCKGNINPVLDIFKAQWI